MDSLIQGNFDGDPGRAMTRAEGGATAVDSAKKASDVRELFRLKKKEEGELRTKAKAPRQRQTQYKPKPTRLWIAL